MLKSINAALPRKPRFILNNMSKNYQENLQNK